MMQNIPNSEDELKQEIDNFINKKNIPACYEKPDNQFEVSFFFPSTKFPVNFEENKNKWKMDDYITHYFDSNGICTYRFLKTSINCYYYDQNIKKITNK